MGSLRLHRKAVAILAAVMIGGALVEGADDPPTPTPNPHIEELRKAALAEPDRKKQEELWKQYSDEEYADNQRRATIVHELWKKENDREKRQELAEELSDLGVRISNYETGGDDDEPATLVIEVATDGEFAQKQIKLPPKARTLDLHQLHTLSADATETEPAWVIRRMTKNRIEVWLPRHGWLFDGKGKLLSEAKPPRRDGTGRQWYGAFLPDGRWVTTDLFDEDKTLTFFTRAGKWLKEIAADKLVSPKPDESRWDLATISWCRCTRSGDGFVLRVGQNGGRGDAWVGWNGQHHELSDEKSAWKLCYPRDLEPKGSYVYLSVPDDSGDIIMTREEPGHGMFVGFPVYEAGKVRVRVPEGETFGFWPRSDNVYIVTDHQNGSRGAFGEWHSAPTTYQTWFYNADGKFAGWMAARRIADTAGDDGMLFVDSAQRVIAVGNDYRVKEAKQFTLSGTVNAEPTKLFPDLRIGFFQRDHRLVLARW
jgi:hypothetical protein